MSKFIFITGGIVSSLGKGVASAAIGALLKEANYKISFVKADPYINVDPGTMNPFQHGEVYITEDGSETDLDLGHYERFTGLKMARINNFTAGQVYNNIIKEERKGKFLGKTVQVVPHITDEIKKKILLAAEKKDILIVEIGGTVGDIESLPFLEAIRQLQFELPRKDFVYTHMTLIPWIASAQELKTKPTQHSVNKLREIGIQPDILLCRSAHFLSKDLKEKIALFTNVQKENVITGSDADFIYEIPLLFQKEGICEAIFRQLHLPNRTVELKSWKNLVKKYRADKEKVFIGIAGKYMQLRDAYKSLLEALDHAAINQNLQLEIVPCDLDSLEGVQEKIFDYDGILVPGGFGKRGSEEKITMIRLAREKKIPFFGICYGFQMAIVEYARNVLNLEDSYSIEVKPNAKNPVIEIMEKQKEEMNLGGTMRLGSNRIDFLKESKIAAIYKNSFAVERHRHRFELNRRYIPLLEKEGLLISGYYQNMFAESLELVDHPWFFAVQYHPEFHSSPFEPHPLFSSFIKAAYQQKK